MELCYYVFFYKFPISLRLKHPSRVTVVGVLGDLATSCATCLSAQLKAELDERNCSVCDCMCSGWPYNQVAIRRQLRTKYGLQLDIATENCGCLFNTCTNSRKTTYTEDCWCVM